MSMQRTRKQTTYRTNDRTGDAVSTVGLWERLSANGASQGARSDRQTVIRHISCELERLLNTRQSPLHMQADDHGIDHTVEPSPIQRSVLAYGVREVIGLSPFSVSDRTALRQRIERAILMFEPRLIQVRVYIDEQSLSPRILNFKIDGVLKTHTARSDVRFSARLDLASQSVRVEEALA